DTADRRRAGSCRAGEQPASLAEDPCRDAPGHSPGSIAPLRGTRSPGAGGQPGPRLVCRAPHLAVRTTCAARSWARLPPSAAPLAADAVSHLRRERGRDHLDRLPTRLRPPPPPPLPP